MPWPSSEREQYAIAEALGAGDWSEGVRVSDQAHEDSLGTCNIAARRIWLNLELAKKSPECLEYILVHELVHLHERHHNDRFRALMDR